MAELVPIRVSELPEASSVSDTDLLIIDNGEQTQKIPVGTFNEEATWSAKRYADEALLNAQNAETQAQAASGAATIAGNYAQDANESAQDAEAWAVGKRAGQDVPSTDDAYHNNAKYFAGQAHTSATEAADSADAATEKATEISAAAAQITENTDDIALLKGDFASVESSMTATRAYAIGDLIIADGQLYRAIAKIANGATLTPNTNVVATSLDAEVKRLDAIKANKVGNYPDLTAGNANQLVSDSYVSDNAPYMMRPSAGGAEIGNREIDQLVGGTVAWNQLCQNGNFADVSVWNANGFTYTVANNVATITSTDTAMYMYQPVSIPPGHKVLLSVDIKASQNINFQISFGTDPVAYRSATTAWSTQSCILEKKTSYNFNVFRTVALGSGITIQLKNAQCIDLTAMFGPTIADYLYSLETSTAGAGVQWFKRLFPNDYYAYDAGSLESVEGVSAHRMTGKNQFDKSIPLISGYIDEHGNVVIGLGYSHTDYIPVVASTVYTTSGDLTPGDAYRNTISYFNASKVFIGRKVPSATGGHTFETPSDCAYIMMTLHDPNVNTVQLEIGSTATAYEPYTVHTYPLDSTIKLQGIFKLDSANRLYADGDIYPSDGQVRRRYVLVDLGNVAWSYDESNSSFYSTAIKGSQNGTPFICTNYIDAGAVGIAALASGYGTLRANALYVKNLDYTDAATFKVAMSGVMLVHKLANPTTETADPYTNPQIVDNLGTEEYVTTGIVPVGHETKYLVDLKSKLEVAPDSPDTDGDYIMRRTSGENVYAPLVIPTELPTMPSENGTYVLKVTVANGAPTLSWATE